jgi:hypothetical protein
MNNTARYSHVRTDIGRSCPFEWPPAEALDQSGGGNSAKLGSVSVSEVNNHSQLPSRWLRHVTAMVINARSNQIAATRTLRLECGVCHGCVPDFCSVCSPPAYIMRGTLAVDQ